MRILAVLTFVVFVLQGGTARATDLPQELVGVWATAESEFNGDRLIGGEALYVLPGGQIALVGAPLPVHRGADGRYYAPIIGIAGTAAYDEARHQLAITLREGTKQLDGRANYLGTEDVIELLEPQDKIVRLLHRNRTPPAWLQAEFDKAAAKSRN